MINNNNFYLTFAIFCICQTNSQKSRAYAKKLLFLIVMLLMHLLTFFTAVVDMFCVVVNLIFGVVNNDFFLIVVFS